MTGKMANNARFVTGSITRHVVVMSLTGAVGLVAVFLADLLDILFLAQLDNPALVAGVGFSASLLFFVRAAGLAVSIATGILVARQLGAGRVWLAKRFALHASLFAFLAACGLSTLALVYRDEFLNLLKISAEAKPYAEDYLTVLLPSAPMLVLGFCGGQILRAHGAASVSMHVSVGAALVNAVLDPIFIFGFGWGVLGAAWATLVSQMALMVLSWRQVEKRFAVLGRVQIKRFIADANLVIYYAFPAMLSNWIAPLGGAFAARQMADFGNQAMAGYTVVMRFVPLSLAVILALSGAIAPIIGQNVGAKHFDRVSQVLDKALWFNWLVTLFMAGLLFLSQDYLVTLFGLGGMAAQLLRFFCSGVTLLMGFDGMQFCAIAAFNNLGKPFYSTIANLGRLLLGTIPFVLLFKALWGAEGVILGYMSECLITGMIGYWLVKRLVAQWIKEHKNV